ncbi:MAG TPA: ABC transporter substrate-binding protein [Stellaceae bacterium]|nr:ABC transporter substrate-binding protein [Stellaceae bacterium]
MRRIGMLIGLAEDDPEGKIWVDTFRAALKALDWVEGENVHLEYRFSPAGLKADALANELMALRPDVILTFSTPATAAVRRVGGVIPIVFLGVADAVGQGFVPSLTHPGGNLTGLTMFEASVTGKWLSMLKEFEPALTRAALVVNPKTAPYYGFYLRAAEAEAPALAIEPVLVAIEDNADAITRAIDNFAEAANGGLLVLPDSTTNLHRDLIIALAARHRLPAVYTNRFFVTGGGLMSYGVSWIHEFRQAASYVDRILRGTKPADLPVQAATKFVTVLNVRTAKALGKAVPASLLVAADEVIE